MRPLGLPAAKVRKRLRRPQCTASRFALPRSSQSRRSRTRCASRSTSSTPSPPRPSRATRPPSARSTRALRMSQAVRPACSLVPAQASPPARRRLALGELCCPTRREPERPAWAPSRVASHCLERWCTAQCCLSSAALCAAACGHPTPRSTVLLPCKHRALLATRWLPDETLIAIASENNLSETAFVVSYGKPSHSSVATVSGPGTTYHYHREYSPNGCGHCEWARYCSPPPLRCAGSLTTAVLTSTVLYYCRTYQARALRTTSAGSPPPWRSTAAGTPRSPQAHTYVEPARVWP